MDLIGSCNLSEMNKIPFSQIYNGHIVTLAQKVD